MYCNWTHMNLLNHNESFWFNYDSSIINIQRVIKLIHTPNLTELKRFSTSASQSIPEAY